MYFFILFMIWWAFYQQGMQIKMLMFCNIWQITVSTLVWVNSHSFQNKWRLRDMWSVEGKSLHPKKSWSHPKVSETTNKGNRVMRDVLVLYHHSPYLDYFGLPALSLVPCSLVWFLSWSGWSVWEIYSSLFCYLVFESYLVSVCPSPVGLIPSCGAPGVSLSPLALHCSVLHFLFYDGLCVQLYL